MKNWFLFKCLCVSAALAVCFSSCSFHEELPALHPSDNLACFSSILICKAGASSSSFPEIQSLDVFAYDMNEEGHLDSYEHIDLSEEDMDGPFEYDLHSTSGEKRVVIVANLQRDKFSYTDILTYGKFSLLESSLYDVDVRHPVLSGECTICAGPGKIHAITLYPLTARIRIRSFEVDFSSRGYGELTMEDVRAYIVNANASCPFLLKEPEAARDFINLGYLDVKCLSSMKCPEMLLFDKQNLTSCVLYCHPCSEGSPGMANPTMLVIEGSIRGKIYYYPLKIGDGTVNRATDYLFDIKITKCGASSPNEEISGADLGISCRIEPWNEYEWENIDY